MIARIILGNSINRCGSFKVDTKQRKILDTEVVIEKPMEIFFFKNEGQENFNYLKLENTMNYFMRFNEPKDRKDLEYLLLDIRRNGFYFNLNPSVSFEIIIIE